MASVAPFTCFVLTQKRRMMMMMMMMTMTTTMTKTTMMMVFIHYAGVDYDIYIYYIYDNHIPTIFLKQVAQPTSHETSSLSWLFWCSFVPRSNA